MTDWMSRERGEECLWSSAWKCTNRLIPTAAAVVLRKICFSPFILRELCFHETVWAFYHPFPSHRHLLKYVVCWMLPNTTERGGREAVERAFKNHPSCFEFTWRNEKKVCTRKGFTQPSRPATHSNLFCTLRKNQAYENTLKLKNRKLC